jgi:hypothetical protein
MWDCYDRCSGERFEVSGGEEAAVQKEIEAYLRDGINADTGAVQYDVVATSNGVECHFDGTIDVE